MRTLGEPAATHITALKLGHVQVLRGRTRPTDMRIDPGCIGHLGLNGAAALRQVGGAIGMADEMVAGLEPACSDDKAYVYLRRAFVTSDDTIRVYWAADGKSARMDLAAMFVEMKLERPVNGHDYVPVRAVNHGEWGPCLELNLGEAKFRPRGHKKKKPEENPTEETNK